MKFADWAYVWLLISISVAIPAGVTVALWEMKSGLVDAWMGVAWGGSAFGVVLVLMYLIGLPIGPKR